MIDSKYTHLETYAKKPIFSRYSCKANMYAVKSGGIHW